MKFGTRFFVGMKRLGLLMIISLLFVSLVPSSASSQLTGPYGTPQLQLISVQIANQSQFLGLSRSYFVQGQVYIGGSWYYLNTTRATANSTSTASGTGGSASAGNLSVSASGGSSRSSTSASVVSQTQVPAPLTLYGYATFYFASGNPVTEPLSFSGGKYHIFNFPGGAVKSAQLFYVGNDSTFTSESIGKTPLYVVVYIEMTNPANNETVGQPLTATASANTSAWLFIDLYNTIVALPQFNDTMLGAWASETSNAFPALPLSPYYNLMAIVGIIVLIPLALADVLTPDKGGLGGALVKMAIGTTVILLFPFIYDHIAYLLNVLNQMIIAYPLPYQYYSIKLAQLEGYMVAPASLNALSLLSTGVLFIGYVVVTVILWIMNFILGTIRILLIAGMVVLFPLSIALRDFRYTQKLGKMIEDTLMGLMLATILSASMLGIADYLLTNWSSVDNMFRLAGIQGQWVAISAVLGALLAPTVLAPLVSTVYMASTQVASIAGGVASAFWLGVGGGGIQGLAQAGPGGTNHLRGVIGGIGTGLGSFGVSLPSVLSEQAVPSHAIGRHEGMIVGTLQNVLIPHRAEQQNQNSGRGAG